MRNIFARLKGLVPAIGGASAGAALGAIDPAFSVLGAPAVVKALSLVEDEFASRLLGDRERQRVASVLSLAKSRIIQRIEEGHVIRTDGLFVAETDVDGHKADEVIERLLLVSQREPEQLKLPYMANLLANSCFQDRDVHGPEEMHALIRIAEQLTYRQLCILSVGTLRKSMGASDPYQLADRARRLGVDKMRREALTDLKRQPVNLRELHMLWDCFDLYQRGLIGVGRPALGSDDIRPSALDTYGRGFYIWMLMELKRIPDDHLRPVVQEFSAQYKINPRF